MRWWIFFVGVLVVPLIVEPAYPQSDAADEAAIPALKQDDVDGLAAVRSDEDAKAFFVTRLRDALGLKAVMTETSARLPGKTKPSQSPSPAQEWIATGGRLTVELITRQLATKLKEAANNHGPAPLRTVLDHTRQQCEWLCGKQARPELDRAVRLAMVVSDFSDASAVMPPSLVVEPYAAYLDRTYPSLIGTDGSWLDLAEHEGSAGVRQRLAAFWDDSSAPRSEVSESEKQGLAAQYFQTRLQAVFLAQVTASAIRADASAEQQALTYWLNLKNWPDKIREARGLNRLCGTWQWTIHNHQRHQEQKLAMVFPPPDGGSFTGPRPAKTVVLGDAIYLRWEFPGSVQEDSLLFTGEGQRLEGSFVNSSGAWGSITAKRTAACDR